MILDPPRGAKSLVRNDGRAMSTDSLRHLVKRIALTAGASLPDDALVQGLRHHFAVQLAIRGVSPATLQQLMDHTDPRTTAPLRHASRDLINALDDAAHRDRHNPPRAPVPIVRAATTPPKVPPTHPSSKPATRDRTPPIPPAQRPRLVVPTSAPGANCVGGLTADATRRGRVGVRRRFLQALSATGCDGSDGCWCRRRRRCRRHHQQPPRPES